MMMNLRPISGSNINGSQLRVQWGSIFCGTIVSLSAALLFLLFGNAVNLSVHNAVDPAVAGGFWSWLYSAVVIVFSFLLGGLVTSRSTVVSRTENELFHGLITWGVTSLLGSLFIFFAGASSPVIRGVATNSANWLALCVISVGLIGTEVGSVLGRRGHNDPVRSTVPEEISRTA